MNYYEFLLPDLELGSNKLANSVGALKGKKILITGGTGFFGQWLLYFLIHLNSKFTLQIELFCLSRDSNSFLVKHPHIKTQDFIQWANVDIKHEFNLDFIPDFVFHMATDVPVNKANNTKESYDSIVSGTKNVLSFLSKKKHKVKLLLTSSGAVYGKQPVEISHLVESYIGTEGPAGEESFYAKAKKISEEMCALQVKNNAYIECVFARCFAFSGPFLAQDKNFAIGNFVGNLIQNKDIVVLGNGSALRSYMYGADLVLWLVMLLIEGQNGEAYNVGSDDAISIGDLANKVASFNPQIRVDIKKVITPEDVLEQYVPSIEKAKNNLDLKLNFTIDYGIQRMIDFNSQFKTMDK